MVDVSHLETFAKLLAGEEDVTEEEIKQMRERNRKYELVRYVYMEKMKVDGNELVNFHFTPGDKFMELPVYDIVKALVEIDLSDAEEFVMDAGELSKAPKNNRSPTTLL